MLDRAAPSHRQAAASNPALHAANLLCVRVMTCLCCCAVWLQAALPRPASQRHANLQHLWADLLERSRQQWQQAHSHLRSSRGGPAQAVE
jgi:hypothetical protein